MIIDSTRVHPALTDPTLAGISLLNEIAARYPDAISFAPGWPPDEHFRIGDAGRYLDRYARHLSDHGADDAAAGRAVFQYGPTAGLVTDLVARWLATDLGVTADPADILITVGAQEALLIILRTLFASPADVLLVPAPSYFGPVALARMLGIELAAVPERPDGLHAADVAAACAAVRARGQRVAALYVVPSYSNPSGASLSPAAGPALRAVAQEEGFLIIEDTPYGLYARNGQPVPPLKAGDGEGVVVHVGSFSKLCAPGLRVGYLVAGQQVRLPGGGTVPLAGELAKVKSVVSVNTSPLAQGVLAGMLLESGFSLAQHARDRIATAGERLTGMLDALARHLPIAVGSSWSQPSGGFFVRLDVPFAADLDALEDCAAHFGVLWCPMSLFHVDSGGQRQIRLAASYATVAQIDAGIARLAKYIGHRTARS